MFTIFSRTVTGCFETSPESVSEWSCTLGVTSSVLDIVSAEFDDDLEQEQREKDFDDWLRGQLFVCSRRDDRDDGGGGGGDGEASMLFPNKEQPIRSHRETSIGRDHAKLSCLATDLYCSSKWPEFVVEHSLLDFNSEHVE